MKVLARCRRSPDLVKEDTQGNLPSHTRDRWSWLWLAVGAILLPFAHVQTVWPIAAWLSPVFLMRFGRTQRLPVGCGA